MAPRRPSGVRLSLFLVPCSLLLALGVAAALAPLIAPRDPTAQELSSRLQGLSLAHPMGTDQFGRDVFSRVLYGLRVSLGVALASVLLAGAAGGLLGLASGYFLGPLDLLLQRGIDLLMAFPTLLLALLMVAAMGSSTGTVVLAIAVAYTPLAARVTRASALSLRGRPFIEAARAAGATEWRVLIVHVAPGCVGPWLVLVSAELGTAVLAESSLSYLGLGTHEPAPSLGAMLSGAALQHMESAPWLAIWPGLALALAVFAFSLLGDGLRDALDPRTRGR